MTDKELHQVPAQGRGALSASFPFTSEGLAALDAAIDAGGGRKAGYEAVVRAHGVSVAAVKKHRVRFPADLKKSAPTQANGVNAEPSDTPGDAPLNFTYGPNPDDSVDVVIWGKSPAWFMAPADEKIARARVPRDLAPPETWIELMDRFHREEFHERNPWVEDILPLCEGLALLPTGKNKIPVDPVDGTRMVGWQSHAFSVDEIRELRDPACGVWCLSYRPGPDSGHIMSIDIDGNSGMEWFRAHGAEPNNAGWRTTRAEDRQKAHYRLPVELLHALVEARGEAAPAGRAGRGEAGRGGAGAKDTEMQSGHCSYDLGRAGQGGAGQGRAGQGR